MTTLAQSIAWSHASHEQKLALAAGPLITGQHYTIECQWGDATLQCLNARTHQFRVITMTPATLDTEDLTGWLVELGPRHLAKIHACPAPQ